MFDWLKKKKQAAATQPDHSTLVPRIKHLQFTAALKQMNIPSDQLPYTAAETEGEVVVSVPSCDVVLFCSSKSAEGLAALKQISAEVLQQETTHGLRIAEKITSVPNPSKLFLSGKDPVVP